MGNSSADMRLKEIIAELSVLNQQNILFKESLDSIHPLYTELVNQFLSLSSHEVQVAGAEMHGFANQFPTNALAAAIFYINRELQASKAPKSFSLNLETKEEFKKAEAIFEKVMVHAQNNMQHGQEIELGKTNLLPNTLTERELLIFEDLLIATLEQTLPGKTLTESDLTGLQILYSTLFEATKITNRLPIFFHLTQMYIHCLNVNSMTQIARDFSFHLLQLSHNLGFFEYGVFGLAKTLIDQKNSASGGTFLCIASAMFFKKDIVYEKTLTELLFEVHKFSRDSKFFPLEEKIYGFLKAQKLSPREQRRTEHLHLSTLCSKNPMNASEIVIATVMNLMGDIQGDTSEVMPWLTLLYSLKKYNSGSADFAKIGYLISFFEGTLPKEGQETAAKYRILTLGHDNNRENINLACELLSKILDSRQSEDIKYDLRNLVRVSDNIVRIALVDNNLDDLIIGVSIKSDISLSLDEYSLDGITRKISKSGLFDGKKAREHLEHLGKNVADSKNESVILIFENNNDTTIVQVNSGQRTILSRSIKIDSLKKSATDAASIFNFDEYRVVQGATVDYSESEQLADLERVRGLLSTFAIPSPVNTETISVVRDVECVFVPFNLIQSSSGEFLSLNHALVDSMSLDKNNYDFAPVDRSDLKVAFWCPVQGGDYPLNILRSRMDDIIKRHSIEMHDGIGPTKALSSQVQIVAAHGRDDIAEFNALFINDEIAVTGIDRIFGSAGKVAVLFVCHSGKSSKNFYNSSLNSMARYLIETKKFEAVIAPCWSLHISIPPIWLEEFLTGLYRGETVGSSHLRATKSVFAKNKNPGAWGCLHLFGNAHFRATSISY